MNIAKTEIQNLTADTLIVTLGLRLYSVNSTNVFKDKKSKQTILIYMVGIEY